MVVGSLAVAGLFGSREEPLVALGNEDEPHPGYVYFVQAESGGPFKVGWALDPESRRRELQVGNPAPLKILDFVRGSVEDERQLHDLLSEFRGTGEWFAPFPQAVDVVRRYTGLRSILERLKVGRSDRTATCDTCHRMVYESSDLHGLDYFAFGPLIAKALKRIERMDADQARRLHGDLEKHREWWDRVIEKLHRLHEGLAGRISAALGSLSLEERRLLEEVANAVAAVEARERAEEQRLQELKNRFTWPPALAQTPDPPVGPKHVCRQCGAVVYGDAFYRHRENCGGAEGST
jgi:rubrerythrin